MRYLSPLHAPRPSWSALILGVALGCAGARGGMSEAVAADGGSVGTPVEAVQRWAPGPARSRSEGLIRERVFSGNRLELLVDGPQFMPKRIEMIQKARETVDLITFLWCDDLSGIRVAEELAAAARRGVRVRVMIDAFNNKPHERAYQILESAGVRPLIYNPAWWGLDRLNDHATHEKIMIVDGKEFLIGGANLCDEYMIGGSRGLWHDLEVHAEGPVAARVQTRMDETWNNMARQDMRARIRISQRPSDPYGIPIVRRVFPIYQEATTSSRAAVGGADAQLNWQQAYLRPEHVQQYQSFYSDLIDQATSRVVLYLPYFIPPDSIHDAILRARARQVQVQVVTNSAETNDVTVAVAGYQSIMGHYLQEGVEIYEYQGRTLHAKAVLIDDRIVSVGSHNMTTRAFTLNGEANVTTGDSEVIAAFERMLADDLQIARRVPQDSRTTAAPSVVMDLTMLVARWIQGFM